MDPALEELRDAGSEDDEVSVIMRLEDGAQPPPNVRVVSRFGEHLLTARLRRGDIESIWARDEVASMKAPDGLAWPSALVEPDETDEADEAQRDDAAPPPAFARLPAVREDGAGVIVGVCDWGFDFTHPNFRNADGSTRVLALWDQRGRSENSPKPFGYGRVHTRAAINAALAQSDPCAALGYHPSSGDPGGNGSHGTHVADIVAGNRREPGSEVGLASGAEIVFVHLASDPFLVLSNFGDSVSLLEALDFVRQTAAGRPCVLHLSAGKTGGEHRGKTPLEQAVDAMLLAQAGLCLVQSVGNYANSAMHSHVRLGPDQSYTLHWLVSPRDRTPNELEIWYSGQDVFDVTLIAPNGAEFSAPLGGRAKLQRDGAEWGVLYHRRQEPNSGLNHINIFLRVSAPPGRWRVALRGREVVDGRLHAWIERDARGQHQSRFPRRQANSRYTTNTIANSFRAIAVGAYDGTRPDRPAAIFSSRGPTADGRQKPELVAPGYRILAARSLPAGGWSGQPRLTVKSGTSMAAPWVSGTVALMFQAAGRPLTIHEVRSLLIGTADPHPGPSGRSSTRLGYGYLNITAAVEAARRLAGEPVTRPPPLAVDPREIDGLDDGAGVESDDDAPLDDVLLADAIGEPDMPAIDFAFDEDFETPISIDELHEAIEASSEMEG